MSLEAQRRYYEKNKERIKAKRKLLYHSDEKVRIDQIKASADCKARRKLAEEQLTRDATVKAKQFAVLRVDGVVTNCGSIAYLGYVLNVSLDCIRRWEREGNIPKTFHYKKRRYYTEYQISLMRTANKKFGSDRASFFKYVKKHWRGKEWLRKQQKT